MLTYTLRFICYTLHVETAIAYCTPIIYKVPGEGTYSVCPDKLESEFTDYGLTACDLTCDETRQIYGL